MELVEALKQDRLDWDDLDTLDKLKKEVRLDKILKYLEG